MRLRYICFFVCETYLSGCTAVLSDEYTVGGAKRHLLMDPEDDVFELSRSNGRDYADFWRTEGCPTSAEQDGPKECCPTIDTTEGLRWAAQDCTGLASACPTVPLTEPTHMYAPAIPQGPPRRDVPHNAPLYDLVIYPTSHADIQ